MAYSKDFRTHLFKVKEKEELTVEEVAERFGVSKRSVFRWKHKPEPSKTREKPATKINMEALKKDVDDFPDDFLEERANRFKVSPSGIRSALKRLKITYKKKRWSTLKEKKKTGKSF